MSFIINEGSNYLKPHTFKRGDLIFISIGNAMHYGIYDSMRSLDKVYYYHLGSPWHEHAYIPKQYENKDSSWLYKKINDPKQGSVDFTNTNASKRIFPIPKEMCTWKLLEIQKDFKKARNLL
jgi:hypothetical protein